jgi:hypothetical protein
MRPLDAAQATRIRALHDVVQRSLSTSIDDKAEAGEVMIAVVATAVSISKQLEMSEDDFFDWVVRVYGWVQIDLKPNQH